MSSLLSGLFGGKRTRINDLDDPRIRDRARLRTLQTRHQPIPETDAAWDDRYDWLWCWLNGEPYDEQDVQPLRLFKAVDDGGDVIAMAERLVQDAQFVVDTDARTIGGGRWSLESGGDGDADILDIGLRAWRRNRVQARKSGLLKVACGLGDAGIAPTVDGRLLMHDPRAYDIVYTPDGLDIQEVLIHYTYYEAGQPISYRRKLTAETIETWTVGMDGQKVEPETTRHGLGVVPFVHLRNEDILGCPEHGMTAMQRLERPMAAMDSFFAQMDAIGKRYGHPHLVAKGFRLNADDSPEMLGKIVNGIPVDAEISYLEAGMGALVPLMEIVRDYRESVRGTIPEFTLAGSGANTSGRALEFRADQFRRKMRDLQGRVYDAFELATTYAYHLADGSAYDRESSLFRIKGPPILPIDSESRSRIVLDWSSRDLLTPEDTVKHGQALGLIDDEEDAAAYAARLPGQQTIPAADQSAATVAPVGESE